MTKDNKHCIECEHCYERHHKPGVNTSGDYVCMVLGSLIAPNEQFKSLCTGVWFDQKSDDAHDEKTYWISTGEAAEILGVTRLRVRQLIEDGQLKAERVGNRYSVDRASVEARAANPPGPGRRW